MVANIPCNPVSYALHGLELEPVVLHMPVKRTWPSIDSALQYSEPMAVITCGKNDPSDTNFAFPDMKICKIL